MGQETIKNGPRLSKKDPDDQKWVQIFRNRSGLSEMDPSRNYFRTRVCRDQDFLFCSLLKPNKQGKVGGIAKPFLSGQKQNKGKYLCIIYF